MPTGFQTHYHPGFQQIAVVDSETGELNELRLEHREEAEQFYHALAAQGMKVRVGMEASGHARWFERLLAELHFELWIGDAAEIRTNRVRKQKTDRQDAQLLLRLLLEDRFPRGEEPAAPLCCFIAMFVSGRLLNTPPFSQSLSFTNGQTTGAVYDRDHFAVVSLKVTT